MKPPFFEQLEQAKSVLIAGAGGGFDVFWGLPEHVARNLYLDRIANTVSYQDLSLAIEAFHATVPNLRAWSEIPC